jgi:GTP cyclohydrolase II
MEVNTIPLKKIAEADFPTRYGHFRILGFEGLVPGTPATGSPDGTERRREEAVALVMGDIHSEPPLVRIHSQCLTGDVFHSMRCDCGQQLELALTKISEAGSGILIYEEQEGRGIGLMPKLQAYELQDQGLDTVEANLKLGFEADCRGYHMPVEILKALGVKKLRLLSNNPKKVDAVEAAGIKVVERVPADVTAYESTAKYMQTKREKMGHLFTPLH